MKENIFNMLLKKTFIKYRKISYLYKFILYFSAIVLVLFSCKKDELKPNWDVDLLAPIFHSTLTIDNIINDTLKQINNDNLVSLIYQNNLYKLNIDSLFKIPDTTASYTAKLNSLNLGKITISHRVSLGDIANMDKQEHGATGGLYELIMTAHNTGQPATITPISEQTFDTIPINANNYFQTVSILQGYIDISINNQLPINITNLVFELKNQSNGTLILRDTFPMIFSHSIVTKTKSIAGLTVSGNMIGEVKLSSPGSSGDVTIDTSNAITAKIVIRDVSLSSAIAKFPDQDVVNRSETTNFNIADIQLSKVIVKEGYIEIEVYNTLQESMHFDYKIPSATLNGIPLEIFGTVPAAQNGIASHYSLQQNLAGYNINMKGIGPFEQTQGDLNGNGIIDADTVNSIYHKIVAGIDSSGNLIPISLNDSIYIHAKFVDVKPEYALGYLGKKTISQSSEINFNILNNISADNIHFDDIKVSLSIYNKAGINADIKINNISSINSKTNNEIHLVSSQLTNPFNITKPNDPNSIYTDVIPTINNLNLNNTNSNVNELISNLPDKFKYSIDILTNPNSNPPLLGTGTDFIYYGDEISASLNVEVPLSFIAGNLNLSDTVDFQLSSDDIKNINNGKLILYSYNKFPLDANIQLFLLDENFQLIDSLLSGDSKILAADINSITGLCEIPKLSKISIDISNGLLQKLVRTKKIKIIAKFNTIPQNQHIKIYSSYTIEFKLVSDFNYHIEN